MNHRTTVWLAARLTEENLSTFVFLEITIYKSNNTHCRLLMIFS